MTFGEGFASAQGRPGQGAGPNEERYRALVEALSTFVWVTDASGEFTDPQPGWEKYTGHGFDQHGGSGWIQDVHPDDRARVAEIWNRVVQTKSWYEVEWRCWHAATQSWRRCLTRGVPVLNADGSVREWVGAVTEIEHQLGVDQVFEREWLRQAQIIGKFALWEFDPATGEARCTPELYRLYEAPPGASLRELEEMVHPDDRDRVIAARARRSADVTFRIVRSSGEIRWIRSTSGTIPDERGREAKMIGVLTDVTDQVELEQTLRVQTEDLETLIDAIPACVWVARDPGCEVIVGNRTANELFGVRPETNLSQTSKSASPLFVEYYRPDGTLVAPDDLPMQRVCRTGMGIWNEELECRLPDGRSFYLIGNIVPLRKPSGEVRGCIAVLMNITELKRAQRELADSKRNLRFANEQLRQLSYAASHDLREPLREVALYSELLERKLGAVLDAETQQFLRICRGGAIRAAELVNDLLSYAQATELPEPVTQPADSALAIHNARQILAASIEKAHATIEAGELPRVLADPAALLHIFQNLLSNAIKFRGADPPVIRVSATRDGDFWRFAVADNGIGIDPAYHQRIFGLFKRLHGRGSYEGTGIGLAICQKIVERYRGRIWVESERGKGATFYFTLPAA
jgi:PAS domain S-box-containing protein